MQTFLPLPSFAESAAVLDDRRLGKQRVETLQILRALHLEDYGWARHPVVLMWRGHARALVAYGIAMVDEWQRRGYRDTTLGDISEFACPQAALPEAELPASELPPWRGWEPLHRSHRSQLLRKDRIAYAAAFPDTPPGLPYVWPGPPAEAPPKRPFSAWVARASSAQARVASIEGGVVGLPAAFEGSRSTAKQRRQARRLREDARPGDAVVALADAAGGQLLRGTLAGPAGAAEVVGAPHLVRPVTWEGTLPRSALARPYQLQNPQLLFALRGEGLGAS